MLLHSPTEHCIRGSRRIVDVPDTLDLADRMALAINALANVWFPAERWALAFNVDFSRDPAQLRMGHITDAFLNIPPKFIEALALCRLASGSDLRIDVDRAVLDVQLALVGADGLTYAPADALPEVAGPRGFAEVWAEGRMLIAPSSSSGSARGGMTRDRRRAAFGNPAAAPQPTWQSGGGACWHVACYILSHRGHGAVARACKRRRGAVLYRA